MYDYQMVYDSSTGTLTEEGTLAFGGLMGLGIAAMVAIIIISLIFYVLYIIAAWKVFTKAGEPGWKAIIPIYNTYITYKISWKTSMFWITLALAIVGGILNSLITFSVFFSVLSSLISIAIIVLSIIQMNKLSKAFGHGAGFTVGLIFLNFIFMLVLGFDSSEYIGPQE